MKKLSVCILSIICLNTKAQQVQNQGFELWTGSFANNWGSVSEAIVNGGKANPHLEVQTTTSHSGNYAMLLQNQNLLIAGGNAAPGTICTCPIVFNGGPILGFNAYNYTPTSYDFWYQFNAVGGDNARTQLYLTKWNSVNNKRDTLASASQLITGPTSSYTQITVPITWLISGQTPDSMQLSFTSSIKQVGGGVPAGGTLYIDDVNFNVTATGIENRQTNNLINIYPNPSNGLFNLSISLFDNRRKWGIEVYNLIGECVHSQIATSSNCQIDLSSLSNGIYNINITSAEGQVNKRLVIVR